MNRPSTSVSRALYLSFVSLSLAVVACAGGPDGASQADRSDEKDSSAREPTSPSEQGVEAEGGVPPRGARAACDTYLSCLLAVTPTAYGAAVQLYGEGSACWATDRQSDGCGKSCDAAFENIAKECSCEGTTCSKCDFPYGSYARGSGSPQDCVIVNSISVTKTAIGPALRLSYWDDGSRSGSTSVELPLACTAPATFALSRTSGCDETWSGSVSSSGDGIVVTGSRTVSCSGSTPRTCSFKWSAAKTP